MEKCGPWRDIIDIENWPPPGDVRLTGSIRLAYSTLREVRRVKDESGRYIWQPGVPLETSTIAGWRYTVDDRVPEGEVLIVEGN